MPFNPGFELGEALDLLALCAILEESDPPLPVPLGWNKLFESSIIPPFDEKWQLWKNAAGAYAVVIRGTVENAGSIAEDLLAFLANAKGRVTVGSWHADYQFAADQHPHAAVTVGFALGALFLLKHPTEGILVQLADKVPANGDVYVTGHSQGAATATLVRSYLEYAGDAPKAQNYAYKTYVYAQPKPGNDHYASDFDNRFTNKGFAFRVNNSLDWVPQVPFTIEILTDINKPNPLSQLSWPKKIIAKSLSIIGKVARFFIVGHVKGRLKPKASVVTQLASGKTQVEVQRLGEGALTALAFDIPIEPSLNFVHAGSAIALEGRPCQGDECKDMFFEHHASLYYKLLQEQLGPARTSSSMLP